MSTFIDWIQQPVSFMAFMLVISCGLVWHQSRLRALPTLVLCAVTLMYWVLGTPAFANYLVERLESRPAPDAACLAARDEWPFVVLGGGFDNYTPSTDPLDILTRNSLQRLYRVIKVAPETATIYVLGGGTSKYKLGDLMAAVLVSFGVENERIVRERNSRSTYENAVELTHLLPPAAAPGIQLVTTAMHLPRAVATFEKQGYAVCEVPADHRFSPAVLPTSALPYLTGLEKSSAAIHEYLGMWVYWLRGYL